MLNMIHQLKAEDVATNRQQLEQLFFQCKEASTGIAPDIEFCKHKISELTNYLSKNRAYLFAFVDKGAVLGFIWSCILSNGQEEKMHILYLVTDKSHRGQGIGGALLNAVEQKTKQLGIKTMELNVNADNVNAIHIYNKRGYSPAHITMTKQL